MGNSRLSSFYDTHLPLAHKKSVFEKAWKMEDENLDKVCMNRFRSPLDLNHWMMRYYNLAHGNFEPFNVDKMGKYYDFYKMEDSLAEICDAIKTKQRPVLVINDTLDTSDESVFESYKTKVQEAFEVILPDKCSFERN